MLFRSDIQLTLRLEENVSENRESEARTQFLRSMSALSEAASFVLSVKPKK